MGGGFPGTSMRWVRHITVWTYSMRQSSGLKSRMIIISTTIQVAEPSRASDRGATPRQWQRASALLGGVRRSLDARQGYQDRCAVLLYDRLDDLELLSREAEALIIYDPVFPTDPFAH